MNAAPPEQAAELGALLPEFLDECAPLLDEVAGACLELERAWTNGDDAAAPAARARAALHTVKGNAATMGFAAIAELAHRLEELCVSAPPPEHAAAAAARLVDGSDRLRSLVDGLGQSDTLRVRMAQLDSLALMVSEALSLHAQLDGLGGGALSAAQREELLVQLGRRLGGLRAAVLDARLMPVATLLGRLRRCVRDLALARGQAIELVAPGAETALDKAIIDRLGEPLLHLVRNAVAHGLEPAAERRRAGKPEVATITVATEHRAGRARVTVADDGRGLNMPALLSRARALDIDTSQLTDEEQRRLVFRPGFSTASQVTELAGRGIGLDVVAAAVAAMGGRVDLTSQRGRGCCFVLDLPLHLAVVPGVVIEIDAQPLVVPRSDVVEGARVEGGGLERLHGVPVLRWRGRVLPALEIAPTLGRRAPASRDRALVLAAGEARRALLCDRVLGVVDAVVQPPGGELAGSHLVSGVTTLADGRPAAILELRRLVEWHP